MNRKKIEKETKTNNSYMPAVSKTETGIQKIMQTRFGLLLSRLRNINYFSFTLPGSSFGSNVFWSVFLTYQS